MTVSPDTPRLVFENLADAVQALRDSGRRLSTPRRLVLEALFGADGPVSAVHLARALSLDESSVYRNLEVLEHQGLLRHIHLGHGPGLYALVGHDDVEYLYCERCAKVTPVSPDRLEPVREQIKARFGHVARFSHFAVVGLCEQCAAQPGPGSRHSHDEPAADHGHVHHHDATGVERTDDQTGAHAHLHSHGDHVHSHPHEHAGPDTHRRPAHGRPPAQ
jgi:Fur family ferric uptake transcriptional regulator